MIYRFVARAVMLLLLVTVSGCGDSYNDRQSEPEPPPVQQNFGSATLRWMPPSSDAQGSSLSDLAGFKIYVGQISKMYTRAIDVGNSTSTVIDNLSEGQWCFSVTAYDTSGNESGFSNELCKVI